MIKALVLAAVALIVQSASVLAQSYPTRPVTLVVPFAAGGGADTLARVLADPMSRNLKEPVVVEDVPGAAGVIGVGRVARAEPDGYTIGIGHLGTNVFNGALYNLPYDLLKDFEPISLLPSNTYMIVAKPSVPANTLPEFLKWLKTHPEEATAGTAGIGTIGHLATIELGQRSGVNFRIVPYRGGAQVLNDLVAGHITFLLDQPSSSSLAIYKQEHVHTYAVMAPTRMPSAPDVPTVDEVGMPGLYAAAWYGLWAPKGTPQPIIARLNAAVVEALADPELQKRLKGQSAIIPPASEQNPQALASFQKREIAKWWPLIKAAGIEIQ